MAFRAGEAAEEGYERAKRYLIQKDFNVTQRANAEKELERIVDLCGPVVEAYPSWHPLVAKHDDRQPETYPNERCGYHGLDHTVNFAHGFVTCPYDDGQRVIDSVANLNGFGDIASFTAERLGVPLYQANSTPILVRCEWNRLEPGHLIPKRFAVPLMLEKELPGWRWSSYGETWETMRPYLLGRPHGNRSSLFVSQETATVMKNIYEAMINTGMYGPLKVG